MWLMRSSGKPLVAQYWPACQSPRRRTKPAIPARTRNSVSHPLALRKLAPATATVDIPAPLQSTFPSSHPSSAPHARPCEVTRAEGLTPTPTAMPPPLQRHRGDAREHNMSTLRPAIISARLHQLASLPLCGLRQRTLPCHEVATNPSPCSLSLISGECSS